jgi:acetyl-CoA decarbonylase/synthase, CODH/ACS complex subunit gamma
MALTGLQIYKLLPQTNCKECGFPTCLAFAMKLAAKQAELAACPYVSAASKEQLEAASQPPIRLVTLSSDSRKVEVGNELVLFRHEKTFYHPAALFVRIGDNQPLAEIATLAKRIGEYQVEYVGINLRLDGIAVENTSGDETNFMNAVGAIRAATQAPLILISSNAKVLENALGKITGAVPLIYGADESSLNAFVEVAKKLQAPLALRANGLNALAELATHAKNAGVNDLVLDPLTRGYADSLQMFTQLRRLAIKKNFRALGYPIIAFPGGDVTLAAQAIAKYAGFVILDLFTEAIAYSLLVLRQNLYTDPQKPIQVQPGLYPINNPKFDSPVLVTTNFSITYFSVANEVEGAGLPAWLLIADADGMSVLTAWAAGKFDSDRIAKSVNSTGVADQAPRKRLILPGHVAVLLGEVEESLPGWQVEVGPREAVDLPGYLKLKP